MINEERNSKLNSLLWQVHDLAHLGNSKALAAEIDKAYSTFRREVNPDDDGAKLGFLTAIQILHLLKDVTVLDQVEALFGRVGFNLPKSPPSTKKVATQNARTIREFGEFLGEVAKSFEDRVLTEGEKAQCRKEGHDVIRAILEFLALIESGAGELNDNHEQGE